MNFKKLTSFIVLVFISFGCAFLKEENVRNKKETTTDLDYVEHFMFLGESYLKTSDVHVINIGQESKDYIYKIFQRLVQNNELILKDINKINFYVINNPTPFLFSLPGNKYFYSSGLFTKHMKSEELFVATFAAEILKSQKTIYEKKIFIPLGFMTTEKMIQLTRIKPEYKKRINEWSFQVLKRAGYDGTAYLNWIQVQNRNSIDFALYLGETSSIMNEEQLFKNFISSQGIISVEKKLNESNSSKEYYNLLKEIDKGNNETRTIGKNPSRRAI